MNSTHLHSTVPMTPGARYRSIDPGSPESTSELIVDRTVRDDLGMLHVVLVDLEGREISLYAEQFEAAVTTGMLSIIDEPARAYA